MKRIPAWILLVLAILTVALLVIGWHDRHEVGLLPFILGIVWGLFVLGSAPKIFSQKG